MPRTAASLVEGAGEPQSRPRTHAWHIRHAPTHLGRPRRGIELSKLADVIEGQPERHHGHLTAAEHEVLVTEAATFGRPA